MKTLLIGEKYRDKLGNSLFEYDFTPIWLPENPNLDSRLSSHIDLSVFKYDKTLVLARYLNTNNLVNYLTNEGYLINFSSEEQGKRYPKDVNLCAAVIGNTLLHNTKYTDPEILALGLSHIDIKQGYARCTSLIIDNHSLITADHGISDAAKRNSIDVLLISDEGISLDGFDRGFIGGASFKAEDTIYFTGDINKHINGKEICEFILKHGFNFCSLTNKPLFDIGGAIYLE